MKTKIIPFDKTLAEKIQAGEIEGKIKTKDGLDVRVICWDRISEHHTPIVALINEIQNEQICRFSEKGEYDFGNNKQFDLVLEVPDNEPQFKPFDKVLVRQSDKDDWRVALYSHFDPKENIHVTAWLNWYQCIPYEGNEHLVGTTNKPKEE